MRRAVILFALLAACARTRSNSSAQVVAAVDSTPADVKNLPPCGSAPRDSIWREIAAPGFRFCVPADWRPGTRRDRTAAASAQWRRGAREWVQWAVGPFKGTSEMMLPYNEQRQESAIIGGRPVQITVLVLSQSFTSFASWHATATQPALTLTGYATDEKGLARTREIVQTVRFDSTALP